MTMSTNTAAASSAANPPPAADAARLEQPSDAVPMESIPQAQSESSPAGTAPTTTATQAGSTTIADAPTSSDTTDAADPVDTMSPDKDGNKDKPADASSAAVASPPRLKDRSDSVMAIGPALDDISAMTPGGADGPVCQITLLLTTGTRHPYKIDARYLARRNVPVPENTETGQPDPFSISIYTLKELILREWRSDWEAKPASPSSIRLIHFGKLLDDKEQLRKYQFTTDSPNVVHMSIRPQDLDDEEPKSNSKAGGSGGAGSAREGGSNCCVIL